MRDRLPPFASLSREAKLVLGLSLGFLVFRTVLATQSSFPFHQGWNEGHYALVADGFNRHPLVPRYGSNYVYNVPPLFPYSVWLSFALFGASELAARLPAIVAAGALLPLTYALGKTLFDDRRTGLTAAVLLATIPYFQLYGGRAQTDLLMTTLFTASLLAIVRGYDAPRTGNGWLLVGGGLFAAAVAAKQPALLLPAVVLGYLLLRQQFDQETYRRTGVLIASSAVFLFPLVAWMTLNYLAAPGAFMAKWEHELLHRTAPFANLPLLVAIAGLLGFTPLVLGLAGVGGSDLQWPWSIDRQESVAHPSILLVWLVVVGAFVAYRTPHGHQYYAVALLPPVALLAARGIEVVDPDLRRVGVGSPRFLVLVIVLTSTVGGSVVLFELSGEFSIAEGSGERLSADAGEYLASTAPPDSRVLVASGFRPQVQWYTRDVLDDRQVESFVVGELSESQLQTLAANTEGPVYVVAPRPSWNPLPTKSLEAVHVTGSYRPTLLSPLNRPPIEGTKFRYYVADRRLVVYRVVDGGQNSN